MGTNTTYTAGTSNQYISMYLYVEESSYDVSSNTSEVIWEIGVRKSSASTASTWGNWSWTVSVNGAGGSGSLSGTVAPGGSLKFTSGSTTVTHNSDGSKTINCDAVIGGKESGQLGVRTFQLTTIPRVSVPTLTAGTAQFGGSIGVMTNRKSESFSHHLYYSLNGGAEVGISDGILDGYTWNIPKDLMNQIPSATSASITLRLYTFSGGVNLGSNTVSFTATVPADVKPTISNAAWAVITYDNSGTAASGIAAAVQGYSKAKVTFDKSKLAFPYSAALKSFSISYNGSSWSRTSNGELSTGVLGSAGAASVTCTVTDTRGRTASASRTLSVNAYSKPTLKNVTIARATEGGDESSSGTYLLLKATAQVASIQPGDTELNPTAVFRGEYKVTTASTYVTGPDLVSGEQTVYAASLDVTKSYTARIVLQDTLGNQTSATVIIPTDTITFFLKDGGKAASFGKYAENDEVVESAWTMKAPDFEVGKTDGSLWLNASSDSAEKYYRMHADSSNQMYIHQYTGKETADREVLHFGSGGVGHLKNGLILGGHSSVVGTVTGVAEASKSVSSGVITDMTNMTLNVGTWVVTGGIRFEGNFVSGSNIAVNISSMARDATFDSTNSIRDGHSASTVVVRLTVVVNPSASTTYHLNCLHNCGSAKTVYYHMRAVRIA